MLAIPFVAVVLAIAATSMFPNSAQWTSGIVCSSPYHLVADWTQTGRYKDRDFACVSGDSSYSVNQVRGFGLQTLPASLSLYVLCLFSFVLWRRSRKRM